MLPGVSMKKPRRSSFLIRDLLAHRAPGHPTSPCPRGQVIGHFTGTPQFSLALSRPAITRFFANQPSSFHLGFNCGTCPPWIPTPCLGLLHGKCLLTNKGNLSPGELDRPQSHGDSPFPVPIPLPVYMRPRAPESPPTGACRNRKSRRSRTVFTELQLMGLERRFDKQKYLSTPDRIELADTLGLSQIQVKTWYQNRRMKWKKQVLSAGGTEPPTKPKGRPKKNSIPSAGELMVTEENVMETKPSRGKGNLSMVPATNGDQLADSQDQG